MSHIKDVNKFFKIHNLECVLGFGSSAVEFVGKLSESWQALHALN